MREKRSRKKVVAAAAVALVMVGGAAFAYWTLSGQGEGSVATQNTKKPLVITQATLGTVAPGETIQLKGSIVNNNNTSIKVGILTPTIKSPGIANESDFELGGTSTSDGVLIPGNTTLQWSGLTLRYIDSETENQDAGMGANVVIAYNLGAYVAAPSGYNAIPGVLPGDVSSEAFQATGTKEFGDEVKLAGTARTLSSMSVVLTSKVCTTGGWNNPTQPNCVTTAGATFAMPLTFNIYSFTGNQKGALLATKTETVNIAYRPSASSECDSTKPGYYWNAADAKCYKGIAQKVTMTMPSTTLPEQVIWSVAYNTTTYGATPYTQSATCFSNPAGCGYDALNVGVQSSANAALLGTDLDPNSAFIDSVFDKPADFVGWRPMGTIATK